MIIEEGTEVTYKNLSGVVAFVSNQYISILISHGKHRSQDVKIVVHHSDFKNIILTDGK